MTHHLVLAFEGLWIAAGLIGYFELVLHVKELPFFKRIPTVMWKSAEIVIPVVALMTWSLVIDPKSIIGYVAVITVVSNRYFVTDSMHIGIVWFATVLLALWFRYVPQHVDQSSMVIMTVGIVGILTPLVNYWLPSTLWVLIIPSFVTVLEIMNLGGSTLTVGDYLVPVSELVGSAIPFWIYLRARKVREMLLQERLRDPLTGAWNRRGYAIWLKEHYDQHALMLAIDLDDFKYVNDTFGHDAGDQILIEVVRRLQGALRAREPVVRLGGDEFLCVLPLQKERSDLGIPERIHQAIVSQPIRIGDNQFLSIRASVGVSLGALNEQLVQLSDRMLLEAKRVGKNRICRWNGETTIHSEIEAPLRWVADAMRNLMEFSPQGFIMTDSKHVIVEVNQSFEQFSGYSRTELIGKKPKILADPMSDSLTQYEQMRDALRLHGFWTGRFQNKRPNGSLWTPNETITAIRVGNEVVGYWALVQIDPTSTEVGPA